MITAKNLTKRYGKVAALSDVTFTIEAGEAVALWGANGAGKTTTLRCLLGVQGFEGALSVNGIDVQRHSKAARAAIGYVPQEAAFYDMRVDETAQFYARLKKAAPHRAAEVLEQVRAGEHASKRVSMLSGGMKQRLALAVALLADPPVLVLDEPTANLDVKAQRDFIRTIQDLNHAGKTVVFSSHRLDEVIALGTRVLVLSEGKLLLECRPNELASKLGLHRWLRLWIPMSTRTIRCVCSVRTDLQLCPTALASTFKSMRMVRLPRCVRCSRRVSRSKTSELVDGDLMPQGDSHA
ncbi:MAG: ABC transporter ATP-binding protein [Chloroflexi bacterium]|nr:ABC transporter ATP-binding protein [Chloroflexota bacterium]